MVKDIVCNMQVDENNSATPRTVHKGEAYYFCTPLCLVQFEANPDRFIADAESNRVERVHKGKGNRLTGS